MIGDALNRFVKSQSRDSKLSRATRNIEFRHEKDYICEVPISTKAVSTIKDAVAMALKKMKPRLLSKDYETDILRWKIKVQNKFEWHEEKSTKGKAPKT